MNLCGAARLRHSPLCVSSWLASEKGWGWTGAWPSGWRGRERQNFQSWGASPGPGLTSRRAQAPAGRLWSPKLGGSTGRRGRDAAAPFSWGWGVRCRFSLGQVLVRTGLTVPGQLPAEWGWVLTSASAPRPLPLCGLLGGGRRNGRWPLWLLQRDPGRGGRGHGPAAAGRPAGWVSEGAAGNERGKSRCRCFPRAGRAGCPPSAAAAAAATSHAARLGTRGSGIWVTGPSRGSGDPPGPPSRSPQICITSASPPKAQLMERHLFPSQAFSLQGRGSALGALPAQTDPNPPQMLALLTASCFTGPFGKEGIRWVALRTIHDPEAPFRPRAGLDGSARPHPPDTQLPVERHGAQVNKQA